MASIFIAGDSTAANKSPDAYPESGWGEYLAPFFPNHHVMIIEGAYALRKNWQRYYDLKILVTIDEDAQHKRIKKRNTKIMYEKFINEWIPRENNYIRSKRLKKYADIINHVKDQ